MRPVADVRAGRGRSEAPAPARTAGDELRRLGSRITRQRTRSRTICCAAEHAASRLDRAYDDLRGICLSAPSRVGRLDRLRPRPPVAPRGYAASSRRTSSRLVRPAAEDLVEPEGRGSTRRRARGRDRQPAHRARASLEAAAGYERRRRRPARCGLAGSELAAAQLGLLRAVARELVASPRLRLLDALVPELLAHGTIGGRRAAAILKAADTKGTGIA